MRAFAALADPTRRRIVELLVKGERPAGEIASQFDVTPQAISHHLNVLKEAKLVRVRSDAQRRLYAVDAAGLIEIDKWLGGVRTFWTDRLDTFEDEYRKHRAKRKSTGRR
jgi:DNA-binding transcriptional ArsR family regulator